VVLHYSTFRKLPRPLRVVTGHQVFTDALPDTILLSAPSGPLEVGGYDPHFTYKETEALSE
jgi:hypothetical protein